MIILRQKEFNSKAQKRLRRLHDYNVGRERLAKAGDAEHAFFDGVAKYPGERIKRVYREGDNWHFEGETRPGVSVEKAELLERKAAAQDPKRFYVHKNIVAGREKQRSIDGYSADPSKVNQRINARYIGDRTLKEDVESYKEFKKSSELIPKDRTYKIPHAKVNSKLVKNLKTAGKVGLGVVGAAGVGYGIKKAVDKKKDKKDDN
jgi:hypothetical protein